MALSPELLRKWPRPPVVDLTELLSVVVSMKQSSLALQLFDQMLQRDASMVRTRSSVVDYTKFLSAVFKIEQLSVALHRFLSAVFKIKQLYVALHLFHQMHASSVNHYTLSIVIDCFFCLKGAGFGFAILGSFFSRKIGWEDLGESKTIGEIVG